MTKEANELLQAEYSRLIGQYGDLAFTRDQLDARIIDIKTRINALNASGPLCAEIEKRALASATPPTPETTPGSEAVSQA